jgi:hypothetical protein
MHPDMLGTNKKLWALDVEKPKAAQLVEWAIRLDPTLARKNPSAAIKQARELYMRAGEVEAKWNGLCQKYAQDEMLRLERPLLASIRKDEDTLRPWLDKNATEERDKFKTGQSLLKAIEYLAEVGVAKGKNDFGLWMVEKLQTGGASADERKQPRKLVCWWLTEAQAKDFLRLRKLLRGQDTTAAALQKEYADSLSQKKPSKKIVAKIQQKKDAKPSSSAGKSKKTGQN